MSNRLSSTINDEKINRIIQIESAGNPDARAGSSTAAGLGQFLKATWVDVGKKHYPNEVAAAGARWADMRVGRATAELQLRMLARFCEDNARIMGSTRDGDLYLAHFLGAGTAMRVVRADQNTPAINIVGAAAAKANLTIIPGKTCAELRAWADVSMQSRWVKAGRKDWVGIWGKEGKGSPDKSPPIDAGKGAGEIAGGAGTVVVTGGVVTGVSKVVGFDWDLAATFGVCFAVIAGAIFFMIRSSRKREELKS